MHATDGKRYEEAPKRDPQFEQFRNYYFDEVGYNKSALFNFFFENNDIFKMITPEDEDILSANYFTYLNRTFNWSFGSLAGVLFVDQVVFRYAFPNYRIKSFRTPLFFAKYICVPLLAFGVAKNYYCKDVDDCFLDISSKYNFGFEEYQQAMDTLERAHRVGKLDDLVEEGEKFDWTEVPSLPKEESDTNTDPRSL